MSLSQKDKRFATEQLADGFGVEDIAVSMAAQRWAGMDDIAKAATHLVPDIREHVTSLRNHGILHSIVGKVA